MNYDLYLVLLWCFDLFCHKSAYLLLKSWVHPVSPFDFHKNMQIPNTYFEIEGGCASPFIVLNGMSLLCCIVSLCKY